MPNGNSPLKPFDAVVIGAGPAGCAVAITCALRGLRVALVERHTFPRFRPGESLHPGVEPLLQQLGIAGQLCLQDALRFDGHWVQWSEPLRFHAFGGDDSGPWRGFQIARASLDATLLQRTVALGVTVHQPCRALKVLTHDNRVTGVHTDSGPVYAEFLIDASGASAWLHRQLGLALRRCSPRLVARYGYVQGCPAPYQQAPHFFAEDGGWTWVARVQEQLTHWTHLAFDVHNPHAPSVPKALRHLPSKGAILGADVSWRISTAAAASGYFMVGDAASLLDPASSHGVLKALITGMQAGQAVYDCLEHPVVQPSAQKQYRHWLGTWFEHDMTQLRRFYELHPNPPGWLIPRI